MFEFDSPVSLVSRFLCANSEARDCAESNGEYHCLQCLVAPWAHCCWTGVHLVCLKTRQELYGEIEGEFHVSEKKTRFVLAP